MRAKVVKNKIAPPFREAEFDIMFNEGISTTGDLVDIAVEEGIIDKAGAWFSYKTTRIGQGRENAKAFLKENPAVAKELREKILASKEAVIAVEGIVGGDGEASAETSGEADE